MNREIYLILKGRIGNQIFMYAFGKEMQKQLGEDTQLIIDDSEVLELDWEDSLEFYNLQNVRFVHNRNELKSIKWIFKFIIYKLAERYCSFHTDYMGKFNREKKLKPMLERKGILLCENGYLDFNIRNKKKLLISGYFQSKKYFLNVDSEIRNIFSLSKSLDYPNLELLKNSNSVCISVKVEHNVGSSLYAVCGKEYWEEAIKYLCYKIPDPVFFVCSDNIEYVKNNLIDCEKYKVVFQDNSQPVQKSLAAMSCCKHFIIGNTSFGWWAQYLSDYPEKITIAPNQWMLVNMPIDIYEEGWTLINVKKYIGDKAL